MPPFTPNKRSPRRVSLPYPTEAVAHRTITRLHSLLNHDADAEAHVSALEAQVDKFRRRREAIQAEIFKQRAVLAPVRMLPIELLAHIFGFVVLSSPDSIAQLRAVCLMWQDAATTPGLWSSLVINTEGPGAARKADLFLRRSGNRPIDITYVQSVPHSVTLAYTADLPWNAWNLISADSERWRSLSVEFFDCHDARRRIESVGPAPLLKELRVSIRRRCTEDGLYGLETTPCRDGSDMVSRKFPLLQSVHIETFRLPSSPGQIFRRLTKLHINDTFSQLKDPVDIDPIRGVNILSLLYHTPNLEDFSFDGEATYQWHVRADEDQEVAGPVLYLQSLRRLQLNCYIHMGQELLEHITSHALEFLSLKLRPRYEVKGNDLPTMQFLSRSPNLRFLHIIGIPCGDLLGFPHRFKHLQALHLEHCLDLAKIADHLPRRISTKWGNMSWYAPKLSKLLVEADPSSIPDVKIAAVVKARYLASQGHVSVAPSAIKELVLNNRDMLTGVAPGEMAVFERQKRFCKCPPK